MKVFDDTPPYGAMTHDMAKWLRENPGATHAEIKAATAWFAAEARERIEPFIRNELFADLRRIMATARSPQEPT